MSLLPEIIYIEHASYLEFKAALRKKRSIPAIPVVDEGVPVRSAVVSRVITTNKRMPTLGSQKTEESDFLFDRDKPSVEVESTEHLKVNESEVKLDARQIDELQPNQREAKEGYGLTLALIDKIPFGKARTLENYPSLKIRKNKSSTVFFLRKGKTDLELLKISAKQKLTEQDLRNLEEMYRRFRLRIEQQMPWNDLGFLKGEMIRRITTFRELLDYYKETGGYKPGHLAKINRVLKRYFPGEWGERKIEAYSGEQFAKDFLDFSPSEGAASDRNDIIKIVNAAYNRAVAAQNVEIVGANPASGNKRSRSKETYKDIVNPQEYVDVLYAGLMGGDHQFALNLILQEAIATRKGLTTHLEMDAICLKSLKVKIPAHINKSSNYDELYFPKDIRELLAEYVSYLKRNPRTTLDKKGNPIFLFESTKKTGQPRANFDYQLKNAKAVAARWLVPSTSETLEQRIEAVERFVPKELRGMNKALFMNLLKATEAQAERASGRSVENKDIAIAYDELTPKRIIELKDQKFKYLCDTYPKYKETIARLTQFFREG